MTGIVTTSGIRIEAEVLIRGPLVDRLIQVGQPVRQQARSGTHIHTYGRGHGTRRSPVDRVCTL